MKGKSIATLSAILGSAVAGYFVGRFRTKNKQKQITGPRYLIINADDLGLSDGVTEGIVKAWQEGVVTSTSAMVNLAGAPERIAQAHLQNPDMPIGLHINITDGKPVLPPAQTPSLVDKEGKFHNRYAIFQQLAQISIAELRAEVQAQADLLLQTGVRFDHIDYHQHLMVYRAAFFEVVCELAAQYQVPVRQPVPESFHGRIKLRRTNPNNRAVMQTVTTFATQYPGAAIQMMPNIMLSTYKKQAVMLEARGIKTTNWLVMALYDNSTPDNFISTLKQLPPGISEIVVHPGKVDDQLQAFGGSYVKQRENDLAMLINPRVRQALTDSNVTPVDFSFVKRWS